jgi:hypothetical protein
MNLQKTLNQKKYEEKFAKQGYTGEKSAKDIMVIAKIFDPMGATSMYLYEKMEDEGEGMYMAFVCLNGDRQCAECGPIYIPEIQAIKRPLGMTFEVDIYFTPQNLEEVINKIKSGGHV